MKIKAIREKRKLSRRTAGRLIGRSVRTVQDWERGINEQDDALVDYLAILTGDLTVEQARQRVLARMIAAKEAENAE